MAEQVERKPQPGDELYRVRDGRLEIREFVAEVQRRGALGPDAWWVRAADGSNTRLRFTDQWSLTEVEAWQKWIASRSAAIELHAIEIRNRWQEIRKIRDQILEAKKKIDPNDRYVKNGIPYGPRPKVIVSYLGKIDVDIQFDPAEVEVIEQSGSHVFTYKGIDVHYLIRHGDILSDCWVAPYAAEDESDDDVDLRDLEPAPEDYHAEVELLNSNKMDQDNIDALCYAIDGGLWVDFRDASY